MPGRGVPVLPLAFLLAGCSWSQVYNGAQQWQRNDCNRLAGQQERADCLSRSQTRYEDYQRQLPANLAP
jgi:hypothetical protein